MRVMDHISLDMQCFAGSPLKFMLEIGSVVLRKSIMHGIKRSFRSTEGEYTNIISSDEQLCLLIKTVNIFIPARY